MRTQQYYPTYKFKNRDVVLSEFEEAQKIANTQNRLYHQLANLLLAFITFTFSWFIGNSGENNQVQNFFSKDASSLSLIIFFLAVISISYFILRYFIEVQKTIVLNSRKVITLRRMLGLDYGRLQLTLPNRRVEGASDPFEIKLFPNLLDFKSSPFWIISITNIIIFYMTLDASNFDLHISHQILILLCIFLFFGFIFRYSLKEIHETPYLILVKFISNLIGLKLMNNFEYILFRTKLAAHEKNRLQYDTRNVAKILIRIEDSRFYKHYGIDWKSIIRSIFVLFLPDKIRKKKGYIKSGASTINMQLCRTLFIPSNQNKYKRKIIESLLAIWIGKVFTQEEIINFYLSSVRFENGIFGIISATKHFFPDKSIRKYSNEEGLFLVERLSNISSSYDPKRVKMLIQRLEKEHKINSKDLEIIYRILIEQGKIHLK